MKKKEKAHVEGNASRLFPKLERQEILVLAAIAIIFSAICIAGFGLEFSDQNVYYYMGKLVVQGSMPYKDFFFSHPPGEIYYDAFLYGLFGFSLLAYKLSSLLAVLGTAFLAYLMMRKHFGKMPGYISAAVFLFTYETIRNASGNIGMSFTVLFGLFGLYLIMGEREFWGGISLGGSGLMTLHAVPVIAAGLLFTLFEIRDSRLRVRPNKFVHALGGVALAFGLPNLLLFLAVGKQYLFELVGYHLLKPSAPVPGVKSALFWLMAKWNAVLFVLPLLFLAVWLRKKKEKGHEERKGEMQAGILYLFALVVVIYIIYLTVLSRVFPYYYFGIFPYIAMIGGYAYWRLAKTANAIGTGIALLAVALFIVSWLSASQYYWDMGNTLKGSTLTDISGSIPSGKPVFGDYLFAPIVALQHGNPIAGNLVDTNPLRFQTGSLGPEGIMNALKESGEVYVVLRQSNDFMLSFNSTKQYVNNDCQILQGTDYSLPGYFGKQLVPDKVFLLRCKPI